MLPLVGASRQEPLHKDTVFVQVLYGESMVWAWPFKQLLEVARGALHGLSAPMRSVLATSELPCRHLFFLLLGGLEAPSSVSSSCFALPFKVYWRKA